MLWSLRVRSLPWRLFWPIIELVCKISRKDRQQSAFQKSLKRGHPTSHPHQTGTPCVEKIREDDHSRCVTLTWLPGSPWAGGLTRADLPTAVNRYFPAKSFSIYVLAASNAKGASSLPYIVSGAWFCLTISLQEGPTLCFEIPHSLSVFLAARFCFCRIAQSTRQDSPPPLRACICLVQSSLFLKKSLELETFSIIKTTTSRIHKKSLPTPTPTPCTAYCSSSFCSSCSS